MTKTNTTQYKRHKKTYRIIELNATFNNLSSTPRNHSNLHLQNQNTPTSPNSVNKTLHKSLTDHTQDPELAPTKLQKKKHKNRFGYTQQMHQYQKQMQRV